MVFGWCVLFGFVFDLCVWFWLDFVCLVICALFVWFLLSVLGVFWCCIWFVCVFTGVFGV